MKKFLLILIPLCILSESKAQYHPMLADTTEWCIAWSMIAVFRVGDANKYTVNSDVVIDSVTYRAIYSDLNGYEGGMREDTATQKVYFVPAGDSVEYLIYDYSMNLGDTINLTLFGNTMGNAYDGNYMVDSVGTVTINGGTRKYLRLFNPMNVTTGPAGNTIKYEWIESVGEIHSPLYTMVNDQFGYSNLNFNCNNDHATAVLKQAMNGVTNYFDVCTQMNVNGFMGSDSCTIDYWGSVKEINKAASIGLYPNPSNGNELTIDVNNVVLKSSVRIKINDETGRLVYSTARTATGNSIKLADLNLNNGIYFISLGDEKNVFAKSKLVVASK